MEFIAGRVYNSIIVRKYALFTVRHAGKERNMKSLVIDSKAVKTNVQAVKTAAKGAEIYADLSGDAYGLGVLEMARLLQDEGINTFAVGEPKDAVLLRNSGFEHNRIMMLRSTADSAEIETLINVGAVCAVGSYEAAVAINGIAAARSTVCEVQIEVDTGMGRYGFLPTETEKIASIFKYMTNLAVVGMFSTYSRSWHSQKQTQAQFDAFEEVVDRIIAMGYEVGVTHICDSAALFMYDFGRLDAVRIGSAFSGRVEGKPVPELLQVGVIEADVEELTWFTSGTVVAGKRIRNNRKLAVVSVGSYHGFGVESPEETDLWHSFLNLFRKKPLYVYIGDKKARVVNRGLTDTVIDVTDVDCAVGDTVTMDAKPVNVKGLPRVYR